jgi:hypothetical protein
VLQIWKARKAAVSEEIANAERSAKAIQDKLNRLDEAFLFERVVGTAPTGPAFSYLRKSGSEMKGWWT